MRFRPRKIIETLAVAGARFILVGGIAVQLHGRARTTIDVDLLIDPAEDNLGRLASALTSMKARVKGRTQPARPIDPALLKSWGEVIPFETEFGDLDLIHLAVGGHTYGSVLPETQSAVIAGQQVRVATREKLIEMKRDAHRPIDREDIDALEAISIIGELGLLDEDSGPER